MRPPLALFVASWLAAISAAPAAEVTDEQLAQLVADYRDYGLPTPPTEAKLQILKSHTAIVNGVDQHEYALSFVWRPNDKSRRWVWAGLRKRELRSDVVVLPADVSKPLYETTVSPSRHLPHSDRQPYLDLALAIQCAARGWKPLSQGLLARSYRPAVPGATLADQYRAGVAEMAWRYWFLELNGADDRAVVLKRLKQLDASPQLPKRTARQNLITDLEQTLATRPTDDPVEAALNELLVYRRSNRFGRQSLDTLISSPPYNRIRGMGLEAVPSLLKHTHDHRVTQSLGAAERGQWHIRISDVVRSLLNSLRKEEFAYDFLYREGRGTCVDQAEVLSWWTNTKGKDAKAYLLSTVITAETPERLEINAGALHVLGRRYPDAFEQFFRDHYDRIAFPHDLYDAVSDSKLSDERKAVLFLLGAKNKNSWHRVPAQEALLRMNHPQANNLYIAELQAIPKTPKVPYWKSTAGRIALVASRSKDESVWIALRDNAKRVDMGQRLEMLQAIGSRCGRSDDQVLRFLAAFLDDDDYRELKDDFDFGDPSEDFFERIRERNEQPYSGPSAGFTFDQLSVRDFAALQVSYKLDLPQPPGDKWTKQRWRRLRERVKAALSQRGISPQSDEENQR